MIQLFKQIPVLLYKTVLLIALIILEFIKYIILVCTFTLHLLKEFALLLVTTALLIITYLTFTLLFDISSMHALIYVIIEIAVILLLEHIFEHEDDNDIHHADTTAS